MNAAARTLVSRLCYNAAMPIFYLEPRDGQTSHPRWGATSLSEACWVVARNSYRARLKVGMATLKEGCFVTAPKNWPDQPADEQKLYSAWLNAHLTDCRSDNPPVEIPVGMIITVTGQSIASDEAVDNPDWKPPRPGSFSTTRL